MAPTAAEFLAGRGCAVQVVTRHFVVGDPIDDTQKPVVLERLLRAGVTLTPARAATLDRVAGSRDGGTAGLTPQATNRQWLPGAVRGWRGAGDFTAGGETEGWRGG